MESRLTVINLDKLELGMRAKDFTLAIFKEVVPHLPANEKWNLTQQLKRASQSIPANNAEAQSHMALARKKQGA